MPVANTGPNHPTGETTLATGSRNERTQLAEQLKVAVLEIWQNAASDDVARLGFGLDAPERIKFWNRMHRPWTYGAFGMPSGSCALRPIRRQ